MVIFLSLSLPLFLASLLLCMVFFLAPIAYIIITGLSMNLKSSRPKKQKLIIMICICQCVYMHCRLVSGLCRGLHVISRMFVSYIDPYFWACIEWFNFEIKYKKGIESKLVKGREDTTEGWNY